MADPPGEVRQEAGSIGALIAFAALVPLLLLACSTGPAPSGGTGLAEEGDGVLAGTEPWKELLEGTPYPYTTALPAEADTALDGFYAKFEPKEGTPVPCKRCPDYLPEGGIWRLSFNKGAFKIRHDVTGWRSLGSFMVDGNRLYLFNDPTCPYTTGAYEWEREAGRLSLDLVEDNCAVDRRARSFANLDWALCSPSFKEGGTGEGGGQAPVCEGVDG